MRKLCGLSVFEGKDRTGARDRRQGVLTPDGAVAFEAARAKLAAIVGWETVSDGDTIEFLARGIGPTRAMLRRRKWAVED